MLTTMAEDWDERNECTTALKTRMMTSKAVLSRRFSKYTIGVYTVCLVFFGASNILSQMNAKQSVETERQLIVKMELPFEYTASPLYEIITIMQFLLQFTCALLAGMLNALIVTLVSWLVFSPPESKKILTLYRFTSFLHIYSHVID